MKQPNHARCKAKALLDVVSEDVKGSQQFFENKIFFEEVKVPEEHKKEQQGPSKQNTPTIDFFQFYQQAIKGRVQKKLEEEEEKETMEKYPSVIPSVTINLDDDESHPPVIMVGESISASPNIEATPPRKLPRRRAGASSNLSSLG